MKTTIQQWSSLLLMLLLGLTQLACSENKADGATLAFSRSLYILPPTGELEVELRVSQAPAATLTVPVEITGSAILGDDYEVSAREFVFEPNQSKASLTLTPKNNLTAGREIRLAIAPIPGYRSGDKKVAVIPVEVKERIMYSFTSSYSRLLQEVEVWVEVQGEISGKSYRAPHNITFPIHFGEKNSSLLGTEVLLNGDTLDSITIPANSRQQKFKVSLAQGVDSHVGEEVTLTLEPPRENSALFYPGSFINHTLLLDQVKYTDMLGKWRPAEIANYDTFYMLEGDVPMEDWYGLLPEHNDANDYLEFTFDPVLRENRIIPHLKGDLASYFCNPDGHTVVFSHIQQGLYDFSTWEEYQAPYFTIAQVNTLFSKRYVEKGDVFLGIDKIDNNTIILYFHEYIPTDFFVQAYSDWGFDADLFGISYKFVRVAE